jgi:hypothetical protein
MKLALTLAAAITAASSFPLTAQQASTATLQDTLASAGVMQASENGKIDANGAVPLQPVRGKRKLSAKTVYKPHDCFIGFRAK